MEAERKAKEEAADVVHDNQRAESLIMKNKIEDRDKAVEIYLTEDELQALYEMPLTGKNDHIRDVFLIGCYTCQRVSDYNNDPLYQEYPERFIENCAVTERKIADQADDETEGCNAPGQDRAGNRPQRQCNSSTL